MSSVKNKILTMRYHYIPMRWPKSGTLTAPSAVEDVKQQRYID